MLEQAAMKAAKGAIASSAHVVKNAAALQATWTIFGNWIWILKSDETFAAVVFGTIDTTRVYSIDD